MKTLVVVSVMLMVLFSSCQYSKGVKHSLATGLTSKYNGFAVEDVYLADGDGNALKSNQVPLGSTVMVIADGVENYQVKDGRVYPGCTIVLTGKNGEELLNVPDAFADMKDGKDQNEASVLKAYLNTGSPMEVGKTYHVYVRFYDKNKPENEIVAESDIVMQ